MSGVRCDCWNCHYQWANYVLDPGPCFEFFFEGAHQFFLSTREILKIQFDQKWWVKSQRQKMLLFNLVILLYYLFILLTWDIKTIQLISEGNKLDSGSLKTRLGL